MAFFERIIARFFEGNAQDMAAYSVSRRMKRWASAWRWARARRK